MILPIDEELARVFVTAYDRLRDAPEGERLPGALAAVRERLAAEPRRRPAKRTRAIAVDGQRRREAWVLVPYVVATAEAFGLTTGDLTGPSRLARIARIRAFAMWVSRRATGVSYPLIGVALGGRDHSSVILAIRKVDALVAADETLGARLRALAVAPPAAGERAA